MCVESAVAWISCSCDATQSVPLALIPPCNCVSAPWNRINILYVASSKIAWRAFKHVLLLLNLNTKVCFAIEQLFLEENLHCTAELGGRACRDYWNSSQLPLFQ